MGNKDRWSSLSMKDRADLIKLYVSNGITSLDNIKKDYNSFGDGGNTGSEQENSEYTTTTKQDLQDVETFNSNWYKYRDAQLANAIKDTYDAKYTEGLNFLQRGFPNWTDQTKVANAARKYINKRLDTVTEFDSREALKDLKTRSWLANEYYNLFPNRKPDSELIGPPKPISDSDLKFITEFLYRGVYNPITHSIVYDKDYKNSATKVHERAHASVPMIKGWSRSPLLNPISKVRLNDNIEADSYYDSVDEIYARLMQLRFVNGLEPTHTYTLDEIKAMRNDSKFIDYDIFDRYTDESILMLLNEVAQNTTNENRLDYVNSDNMAAFGGKLNKFVVGGPVKTFDINNPISPTQYWEDFITKNSIPFSMVPEAPIDENELVKRQAWAESAGNDRAGSHKGAKGRYQIMPNTLTEYQKATGDIGDIYDPVYNRRVRDWEFNRYKNSDQVNRGEPTDSVKMGRRLAIYNYGYGNVRKALNKADSLGTDIDTSFEWLQYLPQETQDYVNFILRGKNTSAHRTNSAYKNRKK